MRESGTNLGWETRVLLRCIKMANSNVRYATPCARSYECTREHVPTLCFPRYWCDVTKEALWNRGHTPRINLACVDLRHKH